MAADSGGISEYRISPSFNKSYLSSSTTSAAVRARTPAVEASFPAVIRLSNSLLEALAI
jgi:hypothetical protein